MTSHSNSTLLQMYTPIFALVSSLELNQYHGDHEELRAKTISFLRSVGEHCHQLGKSQRWVKDAQYAVVALIDESVIRSRWSGRDKWRTLPLGVMLGLAANPGVVFFDRLDSWLKDPQAPNELLEVFHFCLGLGFLGKYFATPDNITSYKQSLLGRLRRDRSERPSLSPNAIPRESAVVSPYSDQFPWLLVIAVAGLILLVLFLVLNHWSAEGAEQLIDKLNVNK